MSRIFWDTNLFIYLFEDQGEPTDSVTALRERMIDRKDQLFTSAMTLGEILVKPIKTGNQSVARKYDEVVSTASTVLEFDRLAALEYSHIRGQGGISSPDAIQLACAASVGMDLFITNDQRLSQKVIPGIHFIQGLATAAL